MGFVSRLRTIDFCIAGCAAFTAFAGFLLARLCVGTRALPRSKDDEEFPIDGRKGAHRFLLCLDEHGGHGTRAEYHRLQATEHSNGGSAALITGVYERTLDANHRAFSVDTERSKPAITLITPGLFADIRVSGDRVPVAQGVHTLSDCSDAELRELARSECFAGMHAVQYPHTGPDCGAPVCERLHCIDSHPPPRRMPNRWRIETNWPQGGWVEWSTRRDRWGQALYVEHWRRLPRGEAGLYLALRRSAHEGRDGFLIVVGDHFIFVDDRPRGPLPPVEPGKSGHPNDRGKLLPLVASAGGREELQDLLSHCAAYGRISQGPWRVVLSTHPWLEGHPLLGPGSRVCSASVLPGGQTARLVERDDGRVKTASREWDVLENTFPPEVLRDIFRI